MKKRSQQSSILIAILLGSAISMPAWAQGGKPVAPRISSPATAPQASPTSAPPAMSPIKSGKPYTIGEPEHASMSIALNASGKQGHLGPIECLQYELHMVGAKPGLAAAKDQELKVTIKVDKTTPQLWAAAMGRPGEQFQNITLSNSAQAPAFEIRLTDAFVATANRYSKGYDPKLGEDLVDVTFKFGGLEIYRNNR